MAVHIIIHFITINMAVMISTKATIGLAMITPKNRVVNTANAGNQVNAEIIVKAINHQVVEIHIENSVAIPIILHKVIAN